MDDNTAILDPALDECSQPYVTRWNGLISTTNWEKGRIIHEWRKSLIADEAPAHESSDEAWSRRVGGVSSQHVGRLRRVYDRFGQVCEQYAGLYWSHFHAALDWNDAEMWLEGAVQSGWSVSAMRSQRWEAQGAPADQKPRDEDIISTEMDEDSLPPMDAAQRELNSRGGEEWSGADLSQGADFGDEPTPDSSKASGSAAGDALYADDSTIDTVRPFENLPELPADMGEAFELFKLSVVRHKLGGWSDVSADDVLESLNALKALVMAPVE